MSFYIILFIFAPTIAKAILGDLEGGNTLSDVTMVVRVIATAILIVPTLSIYRGYLEGHKFITPPSISQVIEQLARVIIIVAGSYLAINVFNLSLQSGSNIAKGIRHSKFPKKFKNKPNVSSDSL